jgi:oxygen-dependent protoporphyrinogen oxidase
MEQDDPALVRSVTEALRPLLDLRGDAEKTWTQRWPRAIPQYQLGHQEWLDALELALADCPGLLLAGASYRGVGIPDCIHQGMEAAQAIRTLASQHISEAKDVSHAG